MKNQGFTVIPLVAFLLLSAACDQKSVVVNSPSPTPTPAVASPTSTPANLPLKGLQQTAEGLRYEELEVGDGPRPVIGQTATIKYIGKLENGQVFDSGKFDFTLGDSSIIKGFTLGVGGAKDFDAMRVGGRRKIVLPPDLGYGKDGDPPKIPPNAVITFELELIRVQVSKAF